MLWWNTLRIVNALYYVRHSLTSHSDRSGMIDFYFLISFYS